MDTTFFSNINWLAVLVAAIAYFALGALWYSPLFGKQWVQYQKIDMNHPDAKKGVGGIMFGSFILMLVATIGLAILVARIPLSGGVMSGLKLGLLTGLFFSATAISITYLYIKKPIGLHFIDGLYHVAGQIVAAIILCIWR
jgi:hypothetical protein